MSAFSFKALQRPKSPNHYLIAPAGLCEEATPDDTSPRFSIAADQLKTAFVTTISAEPRIEIVENSDAYLHITQKSQIFRFTDDIHVSFIELAEGESTLAIYSRSRVGHSDLGVNRKRITHWLQQLDKIVKDS